MKKNKFYNYFLWTEAALLLTVGLRHMSTGIPGFPAIFHVKAKINSTQTNNKQINSEQI
ncbi:MAG: hypothetical protein GY757_06055 [bacterium]|nr:hypothetical protein [bacterium]